MNDCIFCKIVAGEIPCEKVCEDEHTLAFLDIKPISTGHTLVIPKKHFENIYDISPEYFQAMTETARKLAPCIKEAVSADGINLGMNNERAAGQLVFHAHLHIIPRHISDEFEHWHGEEQGTGEIKAAGERIRKTLDEK